MLLLLQILALLRVGGLANLFVSLLLAAVVNAVCRYHLYDSTRGLQEEEKSRVLDELAIRTLGVCLLLLAIPYPGLLLCHTIVLLLAWYDCQEMAYLAITVDLLLRIVG